MKIHKNIKIITWFNFFTDFKLYSVIAILYFSKVAGSFALGMSIFSIAMISSAMFEIPTGLYSDFIGRRKTVILGAVSAVLYSVFYALGGTFLMLAIGAILDGLSQSFYSGNNDALLYDTLAEDKQEHEYHEFLGRASSMCQVALGISAIIGPIIAQWSFSLIMWLSVIPQVICLLLSLLLSEPRVHSKQSGNMYSYLRDALVQFKKNSRLRLLTLSSVMTYGIGEASYQFQAVFYSTLWPVWLIGFAKTITNGLAALSFHYSGKIIKKYGEIQVMLTSNIYNRMINIIAVLF